MLTGVGYTLHDVKKGIFMADRYIGGMLLNFMLSEEVRPFLESMGQMCVHRRSRRRVEVDSGKYGRGR